MEKNVIRFVIMYCSRASKTLFWNSTKTNCIENDLLLHELVLVQSDCFFFFYNFHTCFFQGSYIYCISKHILGQKSFVIHPPGKAQSFSISHSDLLQSPRKCLEWPFFVSLQRSVGNFLCRYTSCEATLTLWLDVWVVVWPTCEPLH